MSKLIVLKCAGTSKDRHKIYECQCDCGNLKIARGDRLQNQRVSSCGCTRQKSCGLLSGKKWRYVLIRAKKRNINVELTIEQAWEIFQKQNGLCALSGKQLEFFKGGSATASLDRIDSSKPYTIDNVWWVHKEHNIAKHVLSTNNYIMNCIDVSLQNKPLLLTVLKERKESNGLVTRI